jgi:transposase-like protein
MECKYCQSQHLNKNGRRCVKQCYICLDCGSQFLESYDERCYSSLIKEKCLEMYVNRPGFRAIERVTGVDHNTVINCVKQLGKKLADVPESQEIPEVGHR